MDQQRISAIQDAITENLAVLDQRFESYIPTDENSGLDELKKDYRFLNISVGLLYRNLAMYGDIISTACAEPKDRTQFSDEEADVINSSLTDIRRRFGTDIDTTNVRINNLNKMLEDVEKRAGV